MGYSLLTALAGGYAARGLRFHSSRNDLIGRDSAYWRLYSEYAREFRAEEDYIVLVESDQPARNRAVVDTLVAALVAPENNPHRRDDRAFRLDPQVQRRLAGRQRHGQHMVAVVDGAAGKRQPRSR